MRAGTPMHRVRCLLTASCLLILTSLSWGAADDSRHPVTLADLQSLSFPDVTLQLSPDGRWLASVDANAVIKLWEAPKENIPAGHLARPAAGS